MEDLQSQFEDQDLERQDLSAENSPEAKNNRVSGIRKYAKMAAIGIMSAALSACGAEAKDSQSLGNESANNAESAEVLQKVPEMSLSRPTKVDQLEHFSIALFFSFDKKYRFIATSLDDPTDQVSIESDLKDAQSLRGQFQNPAPTGFKVEAFDMEGNPVPIDGTRKEGTIFGPDVFDGEPFNELD